MNAKIKKINAEYEKNAADRGALGPQKKPDKQRTELENLTLCMVRAWA
ncbi:MAG: hypothetical protein ACLRXC_12410 [[Clostridium] leptum]